MGNLGEEIGLEATIENIRELLGAIYIQSMRNYDMLSIMADKLGADAKGLSNLHQQGQVLAPPASFVFEENDENDDKNVTDIT
jgi:hypothetical protein